jgi:hypothetical protein
MDPADPHNETLKREWTDQYVEVNAERPELKRFAGIVGRVVTVNQNNKALVDFQDGGWYDISASEEYLRKLDPAVAKAKYKGDVNSAQVIPEKQG